MSTINNILDYSIAIISEFVDGLINNKYFKMCVGYAEKRKLQIFKNKFKIFLEKNTIEISEINNVKEDWTYFENIRKQNNKYYNIWRAKYEGVIKRKLCRPWTPLIKIVILISIGCNFKFKYIECLINKPKCDI